MSKSFFLVSSIQSRSYTNCPAVPILFSGLAFSKELFKLNSVSKALSSNILGAMFGGFLEYNSMYFGFSFLYFLAGFLYFLAFIFSSFNLNTSSN